MLGGLNKIILERNAAGICPICKAELKEDSVIEQYNGKKVFICEHHKRVVEKR